MQARAAELEERGREVAVGAFFVKVTARYGLCALPAVLLLAGAAVVRVGDLLFCAGQIPLDPKTGELVGQFRLGEAKREGFSASPVAVGGKIFFTNDDGETFVLNPALLQQASAARRVMALNPHCASENFVEKKALTSRL